MFCNACGSQLRDGVKFCPLCGKAVRVASPVADDITSVMPPVAADPQVTAEMPVAPTTYPPAYPPAYPTAAVPTVAPPRQRSAAPVIIAIVLVVLLAMGGGAFALIRSGILDGSAKVDEGIATADDSPKSGDSKDDSSTGGTDDGTTTDGGATGGTEPPKGDPVDITPGGSALGASSTLKGYPVSQLVDDKLDTCWAEGAKGYGVGSAISIDLGGEAWVSEVQIVPGYLKYDSANDIDRWFSNGRVSRAKLVFSDGSESETFDLDPDKQGWQIMKLPKPVKTGLVTLRIEGTAAATTGTDHDAEDTSVSEIKVLGFIPR